MDKRFPLFFFHFSEYFPRKNPGTFPGFSEADGFFELYENLADDPLNDGVCKEDNEKTETYVDENCLSLFDFFFITAGGKNKKSTVESVENRKDSKEEHKVSYETLDSGVSRSIGTLNTGLYLIGTEINSG